MISVWKTKRRIRMQAAWTVCLFLLVAGWAGCGDPQAPEFRDVRIFYRSDGNWVRVDGVRDGIVDVPGSPVRIKGFIKDNTAVVAPSLTLIGERRDVGAPFNGECRRAPDSFYECDLYCSLEEDDIYACGTLPAEDADSDPPSADDVEPPSAEPLPAEALIRGDRFVVSLSTEDKEDFQLEVRVREATSLNETFTGPEEEYRVLKLANISGDPNPFLWGLWYRSMPGGSWQALRYGDSLKLAEWVDKSFQLGVSRTVKLQGITYTLEGPPKITWKSLVKWNVFLPLNLDPATGGFTREFQLFDPRVVGPEEKTTGEEAIYSFVLYAEDVPDQRDEKIRTRREAFPVRFVPPSGSNVSEPELKIEELGESGTETTTASYVLTGKVTSVTGEVKSLQFVLSDGAGGEERIHDVDPESISLTGDFRVNLELVSDWGSGVGAGTGSGGVVKNLLEVVAHDVLGQSTTLTHEFLFVPPEDDTAPSLSLLEIFPPLGQNAPGILPADESVVVRGAATDTSGQPAVSAQLCDCEPEVADESGPGEEALCSINKSRCVCKGVPWGGEGGSSMDASGRFPDEPWEMIRFAPVAKLPHENIGILRAEKATGDDPRVFTALGVNMVPDGNVYTVTVSGPVSMGPFTTLEILEPDPTPGGATILKPGEDLEFKVSVRANVFPVNRLVALYNGRPPEEVAEEEELEEFENPPLAEFWQSGSYDLEWNIPAYRVYQGARICLGGESVAGHRSLQLLEFVQVRDGLLVGVSEVTDEALCAPPP